MVYVIHEDSDSQLTAEFFRLLNMPWCRYDGREDPGIVVSFGHREHSPRPYSSLYYERFDSLPVNSASVRPIQPRCHLDFEGKKLPIYCGIREIKHAGQSLVEDKRGASVGCVVDNNGNKAAVFGYDILSEVKFLLTVGQPEECAAIPTLDLHLELFKLAVSRMKESNLLPHCGNAKSILVLTHDVDSPFLRPHFFDTIFAGILARGMTNLFTRSDMAKVERKAMFESIKHFFGLAPDPLEGLPTCLEIEKSLGVESTYFLIARQNAFGKARPSFENRGQARLMRKVDYGKGGLQRIISMLQNTVNEVGLHGVDAWISSEDAIEEKRWLEECGIVPKGNRMHWLYWDKDSPKSLADAGFVYDSTMGFNTTIGYRCGTARPFQFPGIPDLWELPLIIMDTALLSKKKLSPVEVVEHVRPFAEHISKNGGVLTINWHDRSFSSQRSWHEHYKQLVSDLLEKNFVPMTAIEAITAWAQEYTNVEITWAEL